MSALLFIVIIVSVLLLVYSALNQKKRKPFLSGNTSRLIITGYTVVLVLSVFVFYALPEKSTVKRVKDGQQAEIRVQSTRNIFGSVAKEGSQALDKFGGIYKNESFSFNTKNNYFEIVSMDENSYNNIWIERKSEDDGKIEVLNYMTYSVAYNIDITERILPPVIEFADNSLFINPSKRNIINFAGFKNDFTAVQFAKDDSDNNDYAYSSSFGIAAIYLRIPKSMQIAESKLNINYVE